MENFEPVSALIGDIYDAALEPALWPGVLEKTCNFVGAIGGALATHDAVIRGIDYHISWGGDPYYLELYNTKYIKLYPLFAPAMAFTKVGEVTSAELLLPYGEFSESRFFKEWAKPQGYCDVISAMLEKSATSFSTIAVIRHERNGIADEAARRRLKLLTPHFRRAIAIGKVLELRATAVAALADTLDGLSAGIFVIDSEGEVLRANGAARRMLDDGKLLSTALGPLAAVDSRANAALQDILAGARAGDADVGPKALALPLGESDEVRWVAHVLPLTPGTRREPGKAHRGVAALFVQKAALDRPPALQAIVEHYGLTPAELRVLVAVAEIGGVPEIAPALGISEGTVRSHLIRLYEKTGTHRQADLVKLLASFASPLS